METLIAALEERGGGDVDVRRLRAEDSDVITNAIIYRPDRVTAVGATADAERRRTTAAFSNARTPIGQTFETNGETFTVITNHFKSKGSGCGGREQRHSVDGAGSCNADRVAPGQRARDLRCRGRRDTSVTPTSC